MGKISNYYSILRWKWMAKRIQNKIDVSDISIISMNCIGGMIYHDLGQKFLTPTINLFFYPNDFIKLIYNLDYYLNITPTVTMGEKYPIGTLDDIKIYFMHYKTCEDALNKWEQRKKRINPNKIFVIMVEQNIFTKEDFEAFCKIKYPKFLFTKTKEYQCADSLYMSKYKGLKELPDIIPGRNIYNKMALINKIKESYNGQD